MTQAAHRSGGETRLIELDVTHPWQAPDEAGPRRRNRTWLAAGLVLVLVLGLAAGGQRGTPLDPMLVVQGSGVQWAIASTRLIFVLQQPNQGTALLAAYRLADGERQWTRGFPPTVRLVSADDRSVVLGTSDEEPVVTGLDPGTGDVRWQRAGYQTIQGGTAVVVAEAYVRQDADSSKRDVVGLDPVTGATVWQFSSPSSTNTAYLMDEGPRDRLAEYDPDGELRVRDLRTGAVTTVVRIPVQDLRYGYEIIGDLVIAVHESERIVDAYQMGSGTLVWRRPLEGDGNLAACGAVLCLVRQDSISGIDRSTGQEVWRLSGYRTFRPLGDGSLVLTSALEYDRAAIVVEAASGRIKGRLDGWVLLTAAGPGAVVGWRPSPGGGALLALLDVSTGAASVFGVAGEWFTGPACFVAHGYLACLGPTRLSIWRLPTAASAGKMS